MITIIGSGRVGSTIATRLAMEEIDDILLIDIVDGLPQGEALDIGHFASQYRSDLKINGSNDYKDMSGSDLVILTAGLARKPGMTRMDLLTKNASIVQQISKNIVEYAPKCNLMVVTNPLDPITHIAYKATGFPHQKVFGMGGMLDLSRFNDILSKKLGVARSSLQVQVIGEHGEFMLPLPRYSSLNGIPLLNFISESEAVEAVEETRKIAAEVISKKGATFYGPAEAVTKMADAIVKDRKSIFPVSAYLQGQYGVDGIYMGTPVILGKNGVERIIELDLDANENEIFLKGADGIKKALNALK